MDDGKDRGRVQVKRTLGERRRRSDFVLRVIRSQQRVVAIGIP